MEKLGRIAATAVLDINPFEQSTRVLETKLRSIDRALTAQERAFKNNGKSINGLKSTYNLTGKSIEAHNLILEKQKKKYNELVAETGDLSKATVKQKTDINNAEAAMNQTVATIEGLTGSYNALGREIAIQQSNWTRIGTGLDTVGKKMSSVGAGLSSFGRSYTLGVTAPIVAGVAASVKAAISFESAFAGTKKTVDELVDANGNVIISYADLEQGIRDMAKELPASANEIAAVAESAGQLGIQTENVLSFSKSMIDLSESTNMSSEEAATSLARLANITKMPQNEFNNLGSSLVQLGNNFATTESEITEMALRLAGAGSQVGMSEADILGLSAALSSVGINAEMGGSAISKTIVNMQVAAATGLDKMQELESATGMTRRELELLANHDGESFKALAINLGVTTTEMKKVMKSGKDLEGFSSIVGVTGEQFKKSFEEDAVGALGAFINGLGDAENKGTTAIEMLDELGISEVRLRDSLLRAGNASELFTNAVDMSNVAWKENTALTDEAAIRYETTESKLKMLRNEVTDVAIEFGGSFVDALRDGLTTIKPFIEHLAKMAKSFSDAEPETKKMIVSTLGFVAAIGPASSILGKFLKLGGSGLSVVGKLATKMGVLSGTSTAAAGAVELASNGTLNLANSSQLLDTSVAGAATGTRGLSGALGLLNPWVLGITAAVGVGAVAWKLWGEDAYNSVRRVQKWGSDVGKEAETTLDKFQTLSTDSQVAMSEFAAGVEGSGAKVKEATTSMMTEIETSAKATKKSIQEIIDKLPESAQAAAKKNAENLNGDIDSIKNIADEAGAQINRIYDKHAKEGTELTKAENQMVLANRKLMINQELELLNIAGADKKSVLAAVNSDLENMTWQQAQKHVKVVSDGIYKEKESYKKQLENLEEARNSNLLTEKQFSAEKEKLDQTHIQVSEKLMDSYIETARKAGIKELEIKKKVKIMTGLSMKESEERLKKSTKEVVKSNETIVESTTEMSQKTIEANQRWNALVFDEKTGKVKTNLKEVVSEASSSEEGWKNLKFIIKNADLSTNSKDEIAKALIANNQWGKLSFKEKKALVKSNIKGIIPELLDVKGEWDKIEDQSVKDLLIASNSKEEIANVLADADLWDKLEWSDKKLLLDSNVKEKTLEFLETSGKWEGLGFEEKKALIKAEGEKEFAETMLRLGLWNELPIESKKLLVEDEASLPVIKAIEDVGVWDQLSPKVQTAIVEAKGEDELFDIIQRYGVWEKLDEPTKQLLIDGSSADSKIRVTTDLVKGFNLLEMDPKKAEIEDTEANRTLRGFDLAIQGINETHIKKKEIQLDKESADSAANAVNLLTGDIQKYNDTFVGPKQMEVRSEEAFQKVQELTVTVDQYDKTNPLEKFLRANNEGVMGPTANAKDSLLNFDGLNPATKMLKGDNSSVTGATNESTNLITGYNQYNPTDKYFKGSSNAATVGADISGLNSAWDTTLQKPEEKKFTVKTFFENVGKAIGLEKGTNYHKGGDMVVNDQAGPIFKELVHIPGKAPFIPEGRNVLIPNAPQGTKVIPANLTRKIPFYEKGIGMNVSDTRVIQSMSRISQNNQSETSFSPKIAVQANSDSLGSLNNQLQQLVQANQKNDRLIQLMITLISNVKNLNFNQSDLESAVSKAQGKSFMIDNYQRR